MLTMNESFMMLTILIGRTDNWANVWKQSWFSLCDAKWGINFREEVVKGTDILIMRDGVYQDEQADSLWIFCSTWIIKRCESPLIINYVPWKLGGLGLTGWSKQLTKLIGWTGDRDWSHLYILDHFPSNSVLINQITQEFWEKKEKKLVLMIWDAEICHNYPVEAMDTQLCQSFM